MRWRWLIRSLLFLPVLLSLFAGVWSWWYRDTLLFECGSTNWDIESCVGSLRFTKEGGYPSFMLRHRPGNLRPERFPMPVRTFGAGESRPFGPAGGLFV